ncbi:protein translocase subunit SecF [Geoalkalibacter halelectricus]|uniref:Protein-export membrane protein SecF n=1 Tax=Geoalkalibacter halelectricus TaxID=2847045 RepID=A0ABY5ZIH8_9BACT|nr:protein translocase subunit SecF [Geoalkalibacter halelectricus]UWZ78943.1 protein translocase subunit SecF [Geoalkalibacter halelectricus]
MQIFNPNSHYDFVGKNRIAVILSLVIILGGLLSLAIKGGPALGVDFAGGTLVEVRFAAPTQAGDIRDALGNLSLGSFTVQQFGDDPNDFLIRIPQSPSDQQEFSGSLAGALQSRYGEGQLDIRRMEMVGPQVGQELMEKGFLALLYAMAGTLVYIGWRFEFRYAVAAIVALGHDVLVTLGFFSLFDKEFDLTIIAAFLTIIGYSLNDTIVIFDRLRENLGKQREESFAQTLNRSINETLSRTILTSGTTLLVVFSLFAFGGPVIHNFAFALLVGVIAGTYSTIFVAGALALAWDRWRLKRQAAHLIPSTSGS